MGKRLKPQHINIKEYHAKICMDSVLTFLAQKNKNIENDQDTILLITIPTQEYRNRLQQDIISI